MENNNNRISRETLYMEVAKLMTGRSTCLRKAVGCVLVRDNRIVATSYNGVPSGVEHCKTCLGPGCDIVIHAEAGLISYCAKHGISTEGTTMYVTLSPCESCANLIINAGIKKVVYLEEYRLTDGIEKLRYNNVEVEQYE
ncbi:tRNA-specific adenosine deaminase [Clostridium phage P21]|nr:tRNA-specific adenosine deaminase [Clostridium phage P21]